MKLKKTHRGFQYLEFTDRNGESCSIQQSSAIDDTNRGLKNPGSSFLWIGTEAYSMHVGRKMVFKIIKKLIKWLITNNL